MPFLALPTELLLEICTSPVLEIPDIVSVLQTCRRLANLLKPTLISQILKRRSNEYCKRALYRAAESRDRFTVRLLLERGVLEIINIGPTLLNVAVCTLSDKGLTTLLECGVDPNTLDERGRTPLVCATASRFGGAVRALLGDARVDVNRSCIFPDFTALHLAVWTGYDDIVQLLLECPRMDVNRVDNIQRNVLETIAHDRKNGIQHISVRDITAIVRIPLRRGWAPIHGAVAQDDCRILRTLLRHTGLDVNVLSMRGETPLWMSVSRHNFFAVLLLLAQPKTQIYLGVQPILHFAILCAKENMIETLLECERIDVNMVDGNQRTALHIAASIGRIDAIRLLLARSDIDATKLDERGFSARDLALRDFPDAARCFTVTEIAEIKGMEYLDLAIELGLDERTWSPTARARMGDLYFR